MCPPGGQEATKGPPPCPSATQAARGYRVLPFRGPHRVTRPAAPPCAAAARYWPGGAGLAAVLLVRQTVFPRRAAGRPPRRCPPPGGSRPCRPNPCERSAAGCHAGRLADTQRADASATPRPRPQQSLPQPQAKFCPGTGHSTRKPPISSAGCASTDRHRPARGADPRRQRILPAPRL